MKKLIVVLFILFFLTGIVAVANATLLDNGDGTITQIREDNSRIMWLEDGNYAATELNDERVNEIITTVGSISDHVLTAEDFQKIGDNYTGKMTWWGAMAWADQLNHGGYDDWHLPTVLPINGIDYNYADSYDGSTDIGYNITNPNSSVMYIYYIELGNVGRYDTNGVERDPSDFGLDNTGPFINLQASAYYLPIEYAPHPSTDAWYYDYSQGNQTHSIAKYYYGYAWASRDLEPVPEPTTMLLLSSGLFGLIGFRKRFKKY